MNIILFLIANVLMYACFFIVHLLGEDHWAKYPTVFFMGSLILLHLIGAILKTRKDNNEKKKS